MFPSINLGGRACPSIGRNGWRVWVMHSRHCESRCSRAMSSQSMLRHLIWNERRLHARPSSTADRRLTPNPSHSGITERTVGHRPTRGRRHPECASLKAVDSYLPDRCRSFVPIDTTRAAGIPPTRHPAAIHKTSITSKTASMPNSCHAAIRQGSMKITPSP